MAISLVAIGQKITASIANSLINVANGQHQILTFSPAGNTDQSTATTATWITLGNVTIPTWATSMVVDYTILGCYDLGTNNNSTVALRVGTTDGTFKRATPPGVTNQRFTLARHDSLTGFSTGSQSITIRTVHTSGTALRADTITTISAHFTFRP